MRPHALFALLAGTAAPWVLGGCASQCGSQPAMTCPAEQTGGMDTTVCHRDADPMNRGAVVVRWRVQDGQSGRLFDRGTCSSDRQNPNCPDTPSWQICQVELQVTPVGQRPGSPGSYTLPVACGEAELTTDFCLAQGNYDLQLLATVYPLVPAGGAPYGARTPPAVRRTAVAGQFINLDAVVITVNSPTLVPLPDGGTD